MPLRASVTAIPTPDGSDPQDGSPALVLVDGSDTPITANGLGGYRPTPGDRLLVEQVGTQVEVVQFISRGTVPYISEVDISDLRAEVDLNTEDIDTANNTLSFTQNDLAGFKSTTADDISVLQTKLDAVISAGTVGIDIDHFWVGEDAQTIVQVPISQFVQDAVGAPTYQQFADAINVWDRDDIGDVAGYTDSLPANKPPMTAFYDYLIAQGIAAQPYK